jgi:hypothetical protein
MELHTIELCFPAERVFSGGAIISSVTKGIHRIDTTYSSGAESAIEPNAGVATARSVGCTTVELLYFLSDRGCKNKIKRR